MINFNLWEGCVLLFDAKSSLVSYLGARRPTLKFTPEDWILRYMWGLSIADNWGKVFDFAFVNLQNEQLPHLMLNTQQKFAMFQKSIYVSKL